MRSTSPENPSRRRHRNVLAALAIPSAAKPHPTAISTAAGVVAAEKPQPTPPSGSPWARSWR
jgi:hypothetical protein